MNKSFDSKYMTDRHTESIDKDSCVKWDNKLSNLDKLLAC